MDMEVEFSEDRLLDRIFETSPTGIVVLTPDGQITLSNQRAEQLLQLDESEIEGKSYKEPEWTFVDSDGDPVPEAEHPFVQVRESRGPIFNQEFRMKRPHADPIDLSISGAPIVDEEGTVERLVFAFEDISDRRQRERELQVKTEQLEVLNRVVRHDIRNDMAVVMGWLDIVEDEVDTERGRQAMDRVLSASQHVVELTETARDLVEVVTGEGSIETEPIALEPVLESTVDIARRSYPEAEFVVDGSIPAVDVAATDFLTSVFHNLLNNAVQHNDADNPTVVVSAEERDDVVRVRVADDGPGVPESMKWSIFGKGDRGLDSDGTGIGLYLVDTLVAHFGGDVWVEDNEPRGAVFVVELQKVT